MNTHRFQPSEIHRVFTPEFISWLGEAYPGTIIYGLQDDEDAVSARTTNFGVAGFEDSNVFPKPDLVVNGQFENWTGSTPDGWIVGGTVDANNYVEQNANGLRFVSDGTYIAIQQSITVGKRYKTRIVIDSVASGSITLNDTYTGIPAITSAGVYEYEGVATYGYLLIKRATALGADLVISSVECWEMNPLDADIVSATPGQPGAGNFPYSIYHEGVNDNEEMTPSVLDALFSDSVVGSLIAFARVDPNAWTDNQQRDILMFNNSGDYINFRKNTSNEIEIAGVGATASHTQQIITSPVSSFFMVGSEWDSSEFNIYLNNVQTHNLSTLGTITGATSVANIGSSGAGNYWKGWVGPVIFHPTQKLGLPGFSAIHNRSGI